METRQVHQCVNQVPHFHICSNSECCGGPRSAAVLGRYTEQHADFLKEVVAQLGALQKSVCTELAAIRAASEGCNKITSAIHNLMNVLIEVASSLSAASKRMFAHFWGVPIMLAGMSKSCLPLIFHEKTRKHRYRLCPRKITEAVNLYEAVNIHETREKVDLEKLKEVTIEV